MITRSYIYKFLSKFEVEMIIKLIMYKTYIFTPTNDEHMLDCIKKEEEEEQGD